MLTFTAITAPRTVEQHVFQLHSEKGWGMGARVGAIPSAIGGRTISLSHVGSVF